MENAGPAINVTAASYFRWRHKEMVIHDFQDSVENIDNIFLSTVIFPRTEYR